MYAVRDSDGRFVTARTMEAAHRRSRSRARLGSSVNRAVGNDASRKQAWEIVRWLQWDGHSATPFEIRKHWGLTEAQAGEIHGLRAIAFGPGGKGEEWFAGRVTRILSTESKWEYDKGHDAWIKEYRFAAVPGWSKLTQEWVAVRRERKGSKEWRIDRSMPFGGFEALTPTKYQSAAAAKRDADKIFRVFAAARAKGAEIDLPSILGLSGIRREDFNMTRGNVNRVHDLRPGDSVEVHDVWASSPSGPLRSWRGGYEFVRRDVGRHGEPQVIVRSTRGHLAGAESRWPAEDVRRMDD